MEHLRNVGNRVAAAVTGAIGTKDGNIYALILGETGAGKSSLVNLFHFWANERSYTTNDQIDFSKATNILKKSAEAGGSQAKSQTKAVTCYTFKLQKDAIEYHLYLVDTPGILYNCFLILQEWEMLMD